MEDKLVSKHILDASQYEGKGKWKGVIQGWVVFLIIYGITRIPNVQQAMLDFANSMKGVAWLSSGVNFIIHGLWIIAILLVIGTLIKWKEKQPFMEIQIYEDGIGFVTMFGKLERVEHNKVISTTGNIKRPYLLIVLYWVYQPITFHGSTSHRLTFYTRTLSVMRTGI